MNERDRIGARIDPDSGLAAVVLGLCPAAAVSVRVIDALWMSIGLIVVIVLASLCVGLVSSFRRGESAPTAADAGPRRWLGVLALSSVVTACFEIGLLAIAPEESGTLGIYVPVIAVNCLVLGSLEGARRTASLGAAVASAARSGFTFAACLIVVTLVREILGSGTITVFPVGSFSGTFAVAGLSSDPVRAVGLAGGALICIGYLAAALRLVGADRDRKDGADTAAAVPAAKEGDA